MSTKKTFVDFGLNLKKSTKAVDPAVETSEFGEAARLMRRVTKAQPVRTANQQRKLAGQPPIPSAHVQPLSVQVTPQWPKQGDVVIVIQEDEALVKKTVVDMLHEVRETTDFWRERGLWREPGEPGSGMPNHEKTRQYIEQLEAEAEELRRERKLGHPVEDLT